MDSHRTRPLILWLAALAILWGLLRPSLSALTATGAGKASITGCVAADAASPDELATAGAIVNSVRRVLNALLAPNAGLPARFAQADLPSSGAVDAAHPSRAPPALA